MSLIQMLNKRINGLKLVSRNATFKTRLLVGNGCFLSVLNYMLPVFGGAELYLIKMLQVMQNRAARIITNQGWYTPTRILLNQCNWLSVKQWGLFDMENFETKKALVHLYKTGALKDKKFSGRNFKNTRC